MKRREKEQTHATCTKYKYIRSHAQVTLSRGKARRVKGRAKWAGRASELAKGWGYTEGWTIWWLTRASKVMAQQIEDGMIDG